ncbi:copper resistance CopC family protein [Microbacterium sp. ZXX196]|uniref:copper resistance CopC family protein n=1 Tax=Microbacterium sp. ZXX196 TaxID=2609291 RepID=UPI0012B7F761
MTDRTHSTPRSRTAVLLAIGLSALLAPLAAATAASAHSTLEETSPASESVVSELPAEVSLTFSDDLTPPASPGDGTTDIAVFDATCEDAGLLIADPGRADTRDCRDYADGAPVVSGRTATQALDPEGAPAGEYTVVWRVLYGDGHADSQLFTFEATSAWAPAATPSASETAAPSETTSPAESAQPSETPSATTSLSESPTPEAAAPEEDASAGIVIAIVAGVVVLALIALVVWLIVRSRRAS